MVYHGVVGKRAASEGVRRAYAAARVESIKNSTAVALILTGLGLLLGVVYFGLPLPILGVLLGAAFVVLGFLAFRTTALWKTVQSGPRLPRRIRLDLDSTVEITTMQIPVQQRTEVVAADKKPPEPSE